MKFSIVALALTMVAYANAQFTPTFTLTCNADSVVIAITGSVATGQVYIQSLCAAQATTVSTSSHTFNAAACSGGIPTLDTAFTVVIQEIAELTQSTDSVVSTTCTSDTAQQTVTVSGGVGVTPGVTDSVTTGTLAPTFTIALEDGSSGALTFGTVGTAAVLKVTMDAAYTSLFDHKIASITANALTVVSGGCASYTTLSNPDLSSSASVVSWSFSLFIPVTDNTRAATTVTISVVLDVCTNPCTANTCSKRRRRGIDDNTSHNATLSTSVVVYPEDFLKDLGSLTAHMQNNKDDLCIPQASMVAILVGMAVALVICLVITSVMFVKLRSRQQTHDKQIYGIPNASYKN